MKRKIFSKLLMVALVIAAVGSFVSCKDYDDDINNLQKQIDAKAAISELTALQSTLDSKIAAAQTAAQAAQAKADAAATKTSVDALKADLEKAIADAKKAGTDAGTDAGKAIAAANKAQETADAAAQAAKDADAAAKAALEDALKTIEETYQTKAAAAEAAEALAAVKATADAAFTKAEAEELKAEVDGLKEELEAAIDEKIDEKIKEVNNAVASVDAIWAAVTSVEFFGAHGLDFRYGKVAEDAIFGDEYSKSVETYTYKKDSEIKFHNELLVRVNPVNAVITAKDLIILNSKKEQPLADLVTIKEPVRYTELLTRADAETGLWSVPVELKDGVTEKQLKAALTSGGASVLLALGVNTTEDAAEDRYVTSPFDIVGVYGEYEPVADFDVTIGGKSINQIKNRWGLDADDNVAKVIAEDGTKTDKNPELAWRIADGITVPVYESAIKDFNTDNEKFNVVEAGAAERRINKSLLKVKVGEEISISFQGLNDGNIDRYYVVFDSKNALESAPSEIEAWQSYGITGLNVIKKSTEKLTLGFPKGDGDIVGFRIFAVNYDGKLADPDGKAFYVQIGDAADPYADNVTTAQGDIIVSQTGAVAPGTLGAFLSSKVNTSEELFAVDNSDFESLSIGATTLQVVEPSGVKSTASPVQAIGAIRFRAAFTGTQVTLHPSTDVDLDNATGWAKNKFNGKIRQANDNATNVDVIANYVLLQSDKKTYATNWSNLAYVKVIVNNVEDWVDGSTLNFSLKGVNPANNNKVMNQLNIKFTKKLITTMPTGVTWSWRANQAPDNNNVLTLYMLPDNATAAGTYPGGEPAAPAWNDIANWGVRDLSKVVNLNPAARNNFTFIFHNASAAAKPAWMWWYPYDYSPVKVDNTVGATGFILGLEGTTANAAGTAITWQSRVSDGNLYDTELAYAYRNLSLKFDGNLAIAAGRYAQADQLVDAWAGRTKFTTIMDPAVMHYSLVNYNYKYIGAIGATAAAEKAALKSSDEWILEFNGAAPCTLKPAYGNIAGNATTATAGEITVDNGASFIAGTQALATGVAVNNLFSSKNDKDDNYTQDAGNILFTNWYVPSTVAGQVWRENRVIPDHAPNTAGAWAAGYKIYTATLTSDYSMMEDYYDAVITNGGALFLQKLDVVAPDYDVPSTLRIYATDAFGIRNCIVEVPVLVKK